MYVGENGTIRLITDNRAPTINAQKQKIGDLWILLAPIIIWNIWTTRCTKVFSANKRLLGVGEATCAEEITQQSVLKEEPAYRRYEIVYAQRERERERERERHKECLY